MRSILFFLFFPLISFGQCVVIVESTDDYEVAVQIDITGISAPASCTWGYNFNITFDYDVIISGPGTPGTLWTLQGTIDCDSYSNNFFNLPNVTASGSGTTTTNPFNPNPDCLTATHETLGCDGVNIQIDGPGIPAQTISCTFGVGLPISLTEFKATPYDKQVYLDWTTASELENDYFTIEHSTDGLSWKEIGNINGAGTSSETINYTYVHERPAYGINYYRLKQTDYNGDYEYSSPVSAKIEDDKSNLRLYPNPATNFITAYGEPELLENVRCYDAALRETPISYTAISENEIRINIEALAAGVYFLNTGSSLDKFVVK